MASRRAVLCVGAVAAFGLAANAAAPQAFAATPRAALERLRVGNENWVRGRSRHPDASLPRRAALVGGQDPFAVVFACIDSRVAPELVFDQGLGDLLVVRTAAHTCDPLVLGSLEYGPAELAARLVVVLGHQHCGAVTAAVRAFHDDDPLPGHLRDVADSLRPAYRDALKQHPDRDHLVEATTRAQTLRTAAALRSDPLLRPLLARGALEVVAGHYALDTGAVSFG
ncbi:carbonic anhydrase [Streptomyces sp. NRRL B-24484]|uniref:carbonic anhydrase n=1 Tax=Streptomyces sp. NRRL B-24484 TaxID=1463833 RepID=UPI0004BF4895|nr:carbonic anhydrase [Streptomyces sp. NRRL B-24484]